MRASSTSLHLPQPRRRRWRHAVPAAGPEDIPLDLIQTRTFGSRVISKRYLQALAMSWTDIVLRWQICIMAVSTSPARLDGLPTLPGVEHHWVDVQTGSGPVRLHLAASGSGPPGAAPARLAAALVVLAPRRQASPRLPPAHT